VPRLVSAIALWLLLAVAPPSLACIVCIPFPEGTAIDELLKADIIVFARENPDKPFSYIAIETLQGELENPAIDLFVNSRARRRLSIEPELTMVLVRKQNPRPSQPDERDQWHALGYASDAFETIVRRTLRNSATWQSPGGEQARYEFFMRYLASPEREVRQLAYLEVGKAPYAVIRTADAFVKPASMQVFLNDPLYLEWRRLYILLLGVNASETEAELVRKTMHNLAHFNQGLNLSAWATAYIEIDGEQAIDWLETNYLGNPARAKDLVLETLKALSTQSTTPFSELRPRIAESYQLLIETHPKLAGWVARDLVTWQDWSFAEPLAELRNRETTLDGPSIFAIDYYLGRARQRYKLP
jgi:hypothetical protein